jgi:hypothetical protein
MHKKNFQDLFLVINDGGTNFRCCIYDAEDLKLLEYKNFPSSIFKGKDGIFYNDIPLTLEKVIKFLKKCKLSKYIKLIVPVVRGSTLDILDKNNNLISQKNGIQSYVNEFPEIVNKTFDKISPPLERYFYVGSDMKGGLIPARTIIFWGLKRRKLLKRASSICFLPELIGSFFLEKNKDIKINPEFTYLACHTGLFDFEKKTYNKIAKRIDKFLFNKTGRRLIGDLFPKKISLSYEPLGFISKEISLKTSLPPDAVVLHGIHDSTSADILIINIFSKKEKDKEIVHFQGGSFGMARYIIGEKRKINIPPDKKGILIQGDIFGNPVITAMTPTGYEYNYYQKLFKKRGISEPKGEIDLKLLSKIVEEKKYFIIPGSRKLGKETGQFPHSKGRIIEGEKETKYGNSLYQDTSGKLAYYVLNLSTAIQAYFGIREVIGDKKIPIIISGGAVKNEIFIILLSTLLKENNVFCIIDKENNVVSETASIGGAILGKSYLEKKSPYELDLSNLNYKLKEIPKLNLPFLKKYVEKFLSFIF